MGLPKPIAGIFDRQAEACLDLGSPFTAEVCRLLADRLEADSRFGERIADWPEDSAWADALPLRAAGGLNALARSGRVPALTAVYPPNPPPGADVLWAAIRGALAGEDGFLSSWLDGPPQTNEVARSSAILGGCLTIAAATRLPLEIFEIGASAGLNLGFDTYAYDFGVAEWRPPGATVLIRSRWDGDLPPLDAPLAVAGRAGCDLAPLDPGAAADRDRLLAYVWPDQTERLARIEGALAAAARSGLRVERADAADWVEARLKPAAGRARVLCHTIVWQYLPAATRARIEAAITAAGVHATSESPVAWLNVEQDGVPGSANIRLTLWPGGRTVSLGRADYHGRWMRWQPGDAGSSSVFG